MRIQTPPPSPPPRKACYPCKCICSKSNGRAGCIKSNIKEPPPPPPPYPKAREIKNPSLTEYVMSFTMGVLFGAVLSLAVLSCLPVK